MTTVAILAAAIALGIVLGVLFVRLWRVCVAPGYPREFVSRFAADSRAILRADALSELTAGYRRMAREVGEFLLRNLGGVALGLAPLMLVALALDTWLAVLRESRPVNPLGHWISDAEFAFALAYVTAMTAAFLRPSRR